MTIEVEVQRASGSDFIPGDDCFQIWAGTAMEDGGSRLLTIRVVGRAESAELNQRYRRKKGPTNVLAFAADVPQECGVPLLGDIVICAPLVMEEAMAQGKNPQAHWAHLVIHGVLHLLGFDHQNTAQAAVMESREISLLASLGYPDPYARNDC